ncbi:MAG: hypothetical protein AAF600_11555 [Bacteroidota bacterium]
MGIIFQKYPELIIQEDYGRKIATAGIVGSMLATTGSPLLIETLGSNTTQFGVNAGFSAYKSSH